MRCYNSDFHIMLNDPNAQLQTVAAMWTGCNKKKHNTLFVLRYNNCLRRSHTGEKTLVSVHLPCRNPTDIRPEIYMEIITFPLLVLLLKIHYVQINNVDVHLNFIFLLPPTLKQS